MPHRPAARLILGLAAAVAAAALSMPAGASGQAYTIPPDNPFVNTPGARGEIWMLGMRNPYRWSFDRATGDMYIGDVGGTEEEITMVPRPAQLGANLGWNCWSGKLVGPGNCDPPSDLLPGFSYASSAFVVIGGYVIRDPALPAFAGQYIYSRFNQGIRLLAPGAVEPETPLSLGIQAVSGFGEDGLGHLYVTSLAGSVHRLVQNGNAIGISKVGDFSEPLGVAAPPGDSDRLFVFEKGGRIRNRDGSEFLDLTSLVRDTGGEEGLLGFAVAPDYATSGRAFAFYNDNAGDLQVDEYARTAAGPDRADIATRRPIITIPHGQADNHNGGQLLFGPDSMLYLSIGDGGTQGDPEDDAQNVGTLLGKIIRIDVSAGASPPPPPAADTVAPTLRSRVPARQRVLRLRGAVAYVRCSEACSVKAGGVLRIGKRRIRMKSASRASQTTTRQLRIKVALPRKARKPLRKALRRGRRPTVRIGLRATDLAGNRSPLARRTVRVRR